MTVIDYVEASETVERISVLEDRQGQLEAELTIVRKQQTHLKAAVASLATGINQAIDVINSALEETS